MISNRCLLLRQQQQGGCAVCFAQIAPNCGVIFRDRTFMKVLSLKLKHVNELAEGNTDFLRWRMRGHATHEDDSLSEFLQMRGIRHVCCALEATTTSATTEDRRQPAVVVARRELEGERHHRCIQHTPASVESSCDVRHMRFWTTQSQLSFLVLSCASHRARANPECRMEPP